MPLFGILDWFSRRASGTQQICQGIRGVDVHFSGAGLSALLRLFLEEERWWVMNLPAAMQVMHKKLVFH